MARDRAVRIEQLVAAPRSVVWDDLSDLASHPDWMRDAVALTVEDNGPRGLGTTVEVVTRIGPLRTTDHMVVTGWEPPQRIAVHHRGAVAGDGEFTLEDRGAYTLVRWVECLRLPWWFGGAVGAVLARPLLARVWRGNLRRFAARFI
ncbi:MAG: SRPBCC family protein [Acidimicrobiia bacterium]|nr:SRPBCC family protein [Acidimicrobiia bacterium]